MTVDLSKYEDTFLLEAAEHVAAMNAALLEFEKAKTELKWVNDIFREAHTLKSMAATMNYRQTASLCHAIENVLEGLKNQKAEEDACIDALFESFDALDAALKEIKANKREPELGHLMEKLQAVLKNGEAPRVSKSPRAGRSDETENKDPEKIQTIDVKVKRLDLLMNLAEELLINKMQLDRIREDLKNPGLNAAVDSLGRLVKEIQYNIMQSRMVPIGYVFNRFPRMVRDLAKAQKKEIELTIEGADIELDRGIIDEIGDSLVHLLRNCVDHGIESPEVRERAGKPRQGGIRLEAKRSKDYVVIEIADDGAGLDGREIKNSAIRRGILPAGAGREEILNAIFMGVSTTKTVTAVSGRGFGLSIVKKKIETIGGTIEVKSEPAGGTRFVIQIPLTLAIIKSLFVRVHQKTYAIPIVNVERLVVVDRENIKGMMNSEAIVLDGEDIPLARLDVLFGLSGSSPAKQPIAVLRKGRDKLGVAVDALLTTNEIVIKPLNRLMLENRFFAGFTITGSGDVVLILDVANLTPSKKQNHRKSVSKAI
jgi:two-component system, chemotaxis family, sensor kinase CheA